MKTFKQFIAESHPMYNMDFHKFDQSPDGWRSLPEKEHSKVISGYIRKNGDNLEPRHREILHWHLGQTYAMKGNHKKAIRHMEKSINADDEQWNKYAKSTMAFIKGDRKEFDTHSSGENNNKETLDRLRDNFDKPYRDAY
jgi:hypothetical protein